jgi:hypothetical protein
VDSLKLFGRAVSDLMGYEALDENGCQLGLEGGSYLRQAQFETNES